MAEERQMMTIGAMVESLDRFVTDNRHHRDVENRWMSVYLTDILQLARQLRNGNLDDGYQAKVAAFRLAEIQSEQNSRRADIERLEREAEKLRAAHPM